MSTAAIDASSKPSLTGRLDSNGLTVTRIRVDSSTHRMKIDDHNTGSDNGGTFAATDENSRPTAFAVSNADGVSPIALYVNSSGQLLINSH